MSLAWYIAAERDVAGLDIFCNGKSIAHSDEERLEQLCLELGVSPLMDFFSVDPQETENLLEAYLDNDEEPLSTPEEQWFPAADGLVTIRALYNYLTEHPGQLENQQAVLDDLSEYLRILQTLRQHQVRWHLAIDI
ncbi:hypothetical protein [Halopseudomonas pelagia]|uniref:hypothetical protein n=1 Tax=Halopseudomonas pelagia TaxID=553151 RepID=UPI0003A39922|nr:hypothetical protein [Halopseudomonas pelagia]|tara:strand:+ start:1262 stop:1669 length:408 start_codon:yes stop_codon:yes gene_type:complete